MIGLISKLFHKLNASAHPGEIAHAFSCGLILGLMPKDNLLWYVIFVFILFLRIDIVTYAIMILLGTLVSPVFDGLFDVLGNAVLNLPALSGLFGTLYDIPFVAFTKFNNSIVMGSLIVGIVLYLPLYLLGRLFVSFWRGKLLPKIRKSREGKPVKPSKSNKKYYVKKLPKLLRKSYSEKDFEKKLVKKLYDDKDKEALRAAFSEKSEKDKLFIPKDREFSKPEFKQLKQIGKDIRRNKGRFRVAPFIAVVALLASIGITVELFKNVAVKYAIKNAMQLAFGTRTDIGSVNVKIFGSQITIHNLAQTNPRSSDYMKNAFEIDTIDINFNLAQLVRGRFDAENLEMSGLAFNTQRSYSGKLSEKELRLRNKIREKGNEFGKFVQKESETAYAKGKVSVADLFDQYNPEKIIAGVKDNLKSPEMAKQLEPQVKTLVEKWKEKPNEVKTEVDSFRKKSQTLTDIKPDSLKTPEDFAKAIEEIDSVVKEGKKLKKEISQTVSDVKKDSKTVKTMTTDLKNAVQSDKAFISKEINKITSFTIDDGKQFLTGSLDSVAYDSLGVYYPYLRMGIDYLNNMKNSSSAAPKQAPKKTEKKSRRAAGHNVYWKADRIPPFLIEHLLASGMGLKVEGVDISNDMDKRGAPAVINGIYESSKQVHKGVFTVDARNTSEEPLIKGTYEGNNYPVSLDMAKKTEASGAPSFKGTSVIKGVITADSDYSFSVSGNMDINPLTITANAFSPEFASDIYQRVLASIKSMSIGAEVKYSDADGIDLKITSDIDKIFASTLKSVMNSELKQVKALAIEKIEKELSQSTGLASEQIAEFTSIAEQINDADSAVEALNNLLEKKKKELSAQAKEAAKSTAKNAAKSAVDTLLNGGSGKDAASSASDAAKSTMKGFMKGLKK